MRKFLMVALLGVSANLWAADLDLIPTPSELKVTEGEYKLPGMVCFEVDTKVQLATKLLFMRCFDAHWSQTTDSRGEGTATLRILTNDTHNLGEEGYRLIIIDKKPQIVIEATGDTGLFYGMQTLKQMVALADGKALPCVEIVDRPRTKWRGFMIDAGRQYQKIETVEKLLDMMASLKMNVFHWHLTDGDGWRIQIKKHPKLTSVGAYFTKGKEQQGFYTQEEIRHIVKYAAERYITVMPEVDVPGHSEAALTAYPEYTCFGKAPDFKGHFSDVIFCAGKDTTITFLKEVFDEVTDLFPAAYIHLGGDEAPKGQWKKCPDCQARLKALGLKNMEALQAWFMSELIRHLGAKGKTAVVYNDAIAGDPSRLPPNLLIQWWNYNAVGAKGLNDAKKAGLKVVAATNQYCYMNYPIKPWRGYAKNRTADARLTYEKNASVTNDPAIIGMTASLWTDFNLTEDLLPRRLYPRVYILAEQMWSTTKPVPFDTFYKRILDQYYPLLKKAGITPGYGFASEFPEDDDKG